MEPPPTANGSLPRLSNDSEVDERLLCTTGMGPVSWDWRSGVPFLLGRAGGVALLRLEAGAGFGRTFEGALAGDGDVITGREGSRAVLDGEESSSRLSASSSLEDFFLNF
jgi:hypothetical protein